MGKNLILDYVEESPHNTNRAILSQVVDQYVEEVVSSMGPVGASVNADWSQNDETAADYIKNRTHYQEITKTVVVEGFKTETYENKYTEGDEEYSYIGLTNTSIPSNVSLNTKEEVENLKVNINDQPIKVIVGKYDIPYSASWSLENGMIIRYQKGKEEIYWFIDIKEGANIPAGQKFTIDIYVEQIQYIPLDERYLPTSVLEQADWNCNESDSAAYIKNRTHYDYQVKGKPIYSQSSPDIGSGLPYTFQVINKEDNWLGNHSFLYNNCLFDSNSEWQYIGEEYDETLEVWKIKYKCQQTQVVYGKKEILTINAAAYSKYYAETGEEKHFVTIDCEYEGNNGIELYEAEMHTKTLDKRFLPEFSVIKNWSVNNKTDPRYIEDRTHYPYLGQGKELVFDEYDSNRYPDYNYLPYSQITQSDLTQDDCSGYWLGKDAGYWINMGNPEAPQSYLIDAYSNWEQTDEEENNIIVYKHQFDILDSPCTLIVAVQPVEGSPNKYKVELRSATYNGEKHFGVRAAEKMYKTLDIEYLPKGLSQDVDWNENDQNSHSYIKNRPFYEKEATYETAFQQNIEETPYTVPVKLLGSASKYRIICNEETIETGITESWREEVGDYGYQLISTPWVDIKTKYFAGEGGSTTFTTKGDFTVPYDITIQCLKTAIIKQLDEKFIPDTIARTTDVPSIDNTLTVEGAAADAKAVGEAIANISTSTEWNSIQNKPFQEGYNWRLLAKNQNDDNTPIAISEVVYQNPMKFKFVAEDGTEQMVTEGDGEVIVEKPDNGTRFIFRYSGSGSSGVIRKFDIRGTVGGTDTKIMTLKPTSNHSSLSIYQAKDGVVSILNENSVPSSIARMSDISNLQNGVTSVNGQTGDVTIDIPEVDYPVTSVNGKTGDVTIDIPEVDYPVTSVNGKTGRVLLSYENLNNKPFGELLLKEPIDDSFNPLSKYTEGSTIDININSSNDFKMLSGTNIDESLWPSLLPLPLVVVFDEKEYVFDSMTEITSSNYHHYRIIGNASLYKEEYEDTYEPFCIIITNIDDRVVLSYNTEISLYCKPEYYGRTGVSFEVYKAVYELKQLDDIYIPNTIARTTTTVLEDITEAPTAEQYNAILQVLRNAGILSTN